MEKRYFERFLEFLVIGVMLGVVEDLIAVKLATGAAIHPSTVVVIVLVAIPFAALSELVVDRKETRIFKRLADYLQRKASRV
ncbi:MAG: hypothetical protein SVQ76_01500 [Candidatus Nanohaloarchaea archaeon]|nr:hypothetical protein [Candidatus Nanohaloarchaea archaeon]